MSGKYDVVVIGAGPGGYVAAIKAAKLGLKTAIIEERRAGGTCLNRGCIPAKAMIHASSLYREMQEAERFGISASDVTYDYGKIVAYKEETTDKLVQGVEQLLKANGVDVYDGKGMRKVRHPRLSCLQRNRQRWHTPRKAQRITRTESHTERKSACYSLPRPPLSSLSKRRLKRSRISHMAWSRSFPIVL